jgi:hypothetical protein
MFFMFFPEALPYLYDFDLLCFISLHLHLHTILLANNLGLTCIYNMNFRIFILGFWFRNETFYGQIVKI